MSSSSFALVRKHPLTSILFSLVALLVLSANMKATSNTETEFAMGREPNEFSRPTTSTRDGVSTVLFSSRLVVRGLSKTLANSLFLRCPSHQFMEAQGAGVQVIMSARTALEMGCPIQGIVAYTSTHT